MTRSCVVNTQSHGVLLPDVHLQEVDFFSSCEDSRSSVPNSSAQYEMSKACAERNKVGECMFNMLKIKKF